MSDADPLLGPSCSTAKAARGNDGRRRNIMDMNPMFPRRLRKSPSSLSALSRSAVQAFLQTYLRTTGGYFGRTVRTMREHIDRQLLPALQTELLAGLVPRRTDAWKFSCQTAERQRIDCRAHRECKLVYKGCDRIIRLLLTRGIEDFEVDLRRVNPKYYREVSRELGRAASLAPGRGLASLRRLVVCGGTVHSDDFFLRDVESLCRDLLESAPNLEELHLPVCSNHALRSISDMPKLKSLQADRTKFFNRNGLWHLCHPTSKSRYKLEQIHFGVFRHHRFNKIDACKFFACMRAIKSMSFRDEERQLIQVGDVYPSQIGDKVLAYSVLKLAMIDHEMTELSCPGCKRHYCKRQRQARLRQSHHSDQENDQSGASDGDANDDNRFSTKVTHIKVVDRRLKPEYLLESCPDLKGLYIDWQEEQSLPPFSRYQSDWFSTMLRDPQWFSLTSRLHDLEIVFPAMHTRGAYSLSLHDFGRLLSSAANLRRLKLVGAGRESPVPLIHLLRDCPLLVELHLEKTSVHVPDNYEVVPEQFVSRSLRTFRFLGDMTSLLMNEYMTRGVAHYMPMLRELELQPESPVGYAGMSPKQMRELSRLQHLERLSLPLSIRDCEMNMPELVFVLSEMACLRFLTLSWGRWCNAYDISDGKVAHMMRWLFDALDAENANIHLQLSHKLHPSLFSSRRR